MNLTPSKIKQVVDYIKTKDDFVLLSHINYDGDNFGALITMFKLLKQNQKKVIILKERSVPAYLRSVADWNYVTLLKEVQITEYFSKNVILLDAADIERLGTTKPIFENAVSSLNIDHHSGNPCKADINVVLPNYSSTCEILFEILENNFSVSKELSDYIYLGILTDTGSFQYSNIRPETWAIIQKLMLNGADIFEINKKYYKNKSFVNIKSLGLALSKSIKLDKLVYTFINQKDLKENKTHFANFEGTIELLQQISDIEVAAFFKHLPDGTLKVSLRSKSEVDVRNYSSKYNGGGHKLASGFTVDRNQITDIDDTIKKIVDELTKYIDSILPAVKTTV